MFGVLRVAAGILLSGLALGIGTSSAASIADLTNRLLTLSAEYRAGAADPEALSRLVGLAAAREAAMSGLIADQPGALLQQAIAPAVRGALPSVVQDHIEQEEDAEGSLEVFHEDGPGGSRYHYFLRRSADRLKLSFAKNQPALQTGDRVRVHGVRLREAMAVASGDQPVTLLSAAALNTFGPQKTAVILVDFQDKPGQSWLTPTQAWNTVFQSDSATSVSSFYLENSYQQASLIGDVYGVYTIGVSSTNCDTTAIAIGARQAATAEVGAAAMAAYARFVYAFPPNSGCLWWGLGTVGGKPSQAWINGSFENTVVAHELGHNFGLYHSHGLDCGGVSIGPSCTPIEYGDVLDVMGGARPPMHLNAVQKEILGWLDYADSPPITTVTETGVYTLDAYESAGSEPKALKVQTSSGSWYYVEYRRALGFDAPVVSADANIKAGVVVHFWSGQDPNGVYLLDMTPGTLSWSDPALDVGKSFSDPASGIAIAPVWVNQTAGVNVVVDGGGCVRGNPVVSVSPTPQQGSSGLALSYGVSVRNTDAGCAPSVFAPVATVPSGWTAVFTPPALTIAAGGTASAVMKVTSPPGAAAGSYGISLAVPNSGAVGFLGSALATYAVPGASGGTFSDGFDRPDASALGNGWIQVSGQLMIQAGQARNAPVAAMHAAVQPGLVGATQSVSASFATSAKKPAPRFALLLRYKDPQNYYSCYEQAGTPTTAGISKIVNGVETVLKSAKVPAPKKGQFFTLACQASGSKLTLSIDGSKAVSASDASIGSGASGLSMGYTASSGTGSPVSQRADNFSATVH